VADRPKEDDRLKVADRPTVACCRLEVYRNWADDFAADAMAAAVADAVVAAAGESLAIPSCSMSIDSSTTAAHGSAHPSTSPPKK
jgi:hypothetical protein